MAWALKNKGFMLRQAQKGMGKVSPLPGRMDECRKIIQYLSELSGKIYIVLFGNLLFKKALDFFH